MLSSLLMGIAWVFGVAAGLIFWVGGRAIHEMTHADRILSEVWGLSLALVLFGIFALLRGAAERLKTGDKGELVSLRIDATKDEGDT